MFTWQPLSIAISSESQLQRTFAGLEKSSKTQNVRIEGGLIKYEQYTWINKVEVSEDD
jgi:hypothetical protein